MKLGLRVCFKSLLRKALAPSLPVCCSLLPNPWGLRGSCRKPTFLLRAFSEEKQWIKMGSVGVSREQVGREGFSTAYTCIQPFLFGLAGYRVQEVAIGFRREMMPAASPSRPRSGMVPVSHLYPASNAGRQRPDLCWDHGQRAHCGLSKANNVSRLGRGSGRREEPPFLEGFDM